MYIYVQYMYFCCRTNYMVNLIYNNKLYWLLLNSIDSSIHCMTINIHSSRNILKLYHLNRLDYYQLKLSKVYKLRIKLNSILCNKGGTKVFYDECEIYKYERCEGGNHTKQSTKMTTFWASFAAITWLLFCRQKNWKYGFSPLKLFFGYGCLLLSAGKRKIDRYIFYQNLRNKLCII